VIRFNSSLPNGHPLPGSQSRRSKSSSSSSTIRPPDTVVEPLKVAYLPS
jgi:hypothetical protein